MKTSVLDFIDSETLRLDFSEQTLDPAIECILISQCKCRSLEDKIEALKEREAAYTDEDFEKGVYNVFADDLRSSLREYIKEKEEFLEKIREAEDNDIFIINADCSAIDMSAWKTFDAAYSTAKAALDDQGCVILRRKTDGSSDNVTRIFLNEQKEIYDISAYDDAEYCLSDSYAELPHSYKTGDIVRYGEEYAVIADITRHETLPVYMRYSGYTDMCLYCLSYCEDSIHSCRGAFVHVHIPLLQAEICKEDELPDRQRPLIAVSRLLSGEVRIADFLEQYSSGCVEDLLR